MMTVVPRGILYTQARADVEGVDFSVWYRIYSTKENDTKYSKVFTYHHLYKYIFNQACLVFLAI